MIYQVNDMFYSVQGEGACMGRPTFFIRLSGCNLKCSFCDTNHTKLVQVMHKDAIAETFYNFLVKKIQGNRGINSFHVCITGGEPLLQDLRPLIAELDLVKESLKPYLHILSFSIETNGTIKPDDYLYRRCMFSVSPKVAYKDLQVKRSVLNIKLLFPFLHGIQPNEFKILSANYNGIQPIVSDDPEVTKNNLAGALEYVSENPDWSLSMQLHKLINVK